VKGRGSVVREGAKPPPFYFSLKKKRKHKRAKERRRLCYKIPSPFDNEPDLTWHLRGASAPLLKNLPLPLNKGKGIKGMGLINKP